MNRLRILNLDLGHIPRTNEQLASWGEQRIRDRCGKRRGGVDSFLLDRFGDDLGPWGGGESELVQRTQDSRQYGVVKKEIRNKITEQYTFLGRKRNKLFLASHSVGLPIRA